MLLKLAYTYAGLDESCESEVLVQMVNVSYIIHVRDHNNHNLSIFIIRI